MKPPILIGGIGRSGTTLLSLMLDSHRDIKCGPELHFSGPKNLGPYILLCLDRHYRKPTPERPSGAKAGCQFIARCERLGVTPDELREVVLQRPGVFIEFSHRAELVDRLCRFAMEKSGKRRWGIKIMNGIQSVPRYLDAWPEARFIHVVKDPRENVASLLRMPWGPNTVDKAASLWVRAVDAAFAGARQARAHLMVMRWEDLCVSTEVVMRAVLDWLGEEWDESVLHHHEMPHTFLDTPYGHPSATQVCNPVDPSMVGKWMQVLTPAAVERVLEICGERMGDLGYEP